MTAWYETPLGKARITEIAEAKAERERIAEQAAIVQRENEEKKRERVTAGRIARRMYAAAKTNRLTSDWRGDDSSADAELVSSLRQLRGRSRQLCRDFSYAKRAKRLIVNNVIGPNGIGMQAQVKTNGGDLITRINDDIEDAWDEWCAADSCHIGGRLHFTAFERQLMAQIFEAGEVFVRLHYRAAGRSKIPLTLELIESERLADDYFSPVTALGAGNHIRMGVEMDRYYRPQAYWFRSRHPGDVRWPNQGRDEYERVPAAEVIHLALVERWPQTRGEPWMHAAARRLNDMDGYSEAEIVKARAQANVGGFIETPEDVESFGELMDDGSAEMETEAGVFKRLNPGEEAKMPPATAPNSAFAEFMRAMLREVSAGAGPSYEAISRDYSQSNYSSSRMGILDDRDEYRFIQWFMIRDFRQRLHPVWLQQAMFAQRITTITLEAYALNPRKFEAVKYKPRGWTWIDPTTEVDAYLKAIEGGLTTLTDVIAATADGRDLEEILTTRAYELEQMKAKKLVFTTSPEVYAKEDKPASEPTPPTGGEGNQQSTNTDPAARVRPIRRV